MKQGTFILDHFSWFIENALGEIAYKSLLELTHVDETSWVFNNNPRMTYALTVTNLFAIKRFFQVRNNKISTKRTGKSKYNAGFLTESLMRYFTKDFILCVNEFLLDISIYNRNKDFYLMHYIPEGSNNKILYSVFDSSTRNYLWDKYYTKLYNSSPNKYWVFSHLERYGIMYINTKTKCELFIPLAPYYNIVFNRKTYSNQESIKNAFRKYE